MHDLHNLHCQIVEMATRCIPLPRDLSPFPSYWILFPGVSAEVSMELLGEVASAAGAGDGMILLSAFESKW